MTVHQLTEGEPADWIPVELLFDQYREAVACVAMDADDQQAWMRSGEVHVPSDEILQQLDDAIYCFQPRLMRADWLLRMARSPSPPCSMSSILGRTSPCGSPTKQCTATNGCTCARLRDAR